MPSSWGQGLPGRFVPGASRTAASRWRSSSRTSWAASAPTTRACRRRRCCDRRRLLAEVRRVPGAAEAASGELDVEAALRRRDEVIHDLDDSGQLPWLEERGIELFRGPGGIDGERRVKVGDDVSVARRAVVVATGSEAAIPPIDGLREAEPWDNRQATTSKEVPDEPRRARRRACRRRDGAGLAQLRCRGRHSSKRWTGCCRTRSRLPASRWPTPSASAVWTCAPAPGRARSARRAGA